MAANADGEILARGNMVMEGLLGSARATADAIKGGYFHTGDGGDDRRRKLL